MAAPLCIAATNPSSPSGSEIQRTEGCSARIACVPSEESPSTTMCSKSLKLWRATESRVSRRNRAEFKETVTTERSGARSDIADRAVLDHGVAGDQLANPLIERY